MASYVVENYDEMMREFDGLYDAGLKASKRCMQAGARAVGKQIRAAAPSAFRRTIGASIKRSKEGVYTAYVGYRNKEGLPSGKSVPVWFKAYWINYGTLEHRDPEHHFAYKVKNLRGKAGVDRRGGIRPRNFFEAGLNNWDKVFASAFEAQLDKEMQQL